ncbi:MAG: accessory gene regulator B family protein [Paenibacillaceae bacterium]
MVNLDAFAERIAFKMKSINNEKTASIEVMKYGLLIFFNLFSIVVSSTLIGFVTGKLMETLFVLLAFAVLRACTGGRHLKSSIGCILFSATILSIIPHIPLNQISTLIVTISTIIIIIFFAPFELENQTNIPKKYYPLLKAIAIILVTINIFFLSEALAICSFIQSLMLIRGKGGIVDEKNSSI